MAVDYEWSYRVFTDGEDATPEEWLREAWEKAAPSVRMFLRVAWRYGLGFRLGRTVDCMHILGWRITESTSSQVTVEVDSRLMGATNAVIVDGDQLRWRTVVSYQNSIGKLLWIAATVIHQWLVPRLMSRAAHR